MKSLLLHFRGCAGLYLDILPTLTSQKRELLLCNCWYATAYLCRLSPIAAAYTAAQCTAGGSNGTPRTSISKWIILTGRTEPTAEHTISRWTTWQIPTRSSRPHDHAWAIPEATICIILQTREGLKRCAEVVWHHVTTVLGVVVSLSSVRPIPWPQPGYHGAGFACQALVV